MGNGYVDNGNMDNGNTDDAAKLAELRAIVEGIKDRVRAQYPGRAVTIDSKSSEPIRVPIADLMPIVHARDAAQAKMASIGSVNPRRGGLVNNTIQSVKRNVARGLNWFVRDQIVFNRAAIACVEATMESLNDLNRSMTALGAKVDERLQQDRQAIQPRLQALEIQGQSVVHLPAQWQEALRAWELRESELRRKMAESNLAAERSAIQTLHAFEARAADLERSFSELVRARVQEFAESGKVQHAAFDVSLTQSAIAVQARLDRDLKAIQLGFEKLIHHELRVIRQRPAAEAVPAAMDYLAFSHHFRGTEEYVKGSQSFYAPHFQGCHAVLDVGCGQGEFLEVMRQAGIPTHGIDQSEDSVAYCRSKSLDAEQADLFTYLGAAPARSLDGVFCSQVVEHLPAKGIPELIRLCAAALQSGGVLAIETPNPECLAIFATHFYLDPTHVRPVPAALLGFYLQEAGFGGIEVKPRFPAPDFYPELNSLPEGFRDKFFGGMDYAIFARKL